ncbi:MAG: hypothetical protein K2J04_13235, partial [Lachnospiraceae bacterium]|nr:hypothetical protein [Lachnospiraceae bacterium]
YRLYTILYRICLFFANCIFGEIKKAVQSVLFAQFSLCYTLLQVFLSLIFTLMGFRYMREKDITRGKA